MKSSRQRLAVILSSVIGVTGACGSLSNDRFRSLDDQALKSAFAESATTSTTRPPIFTAPSTSAQTTTTTTIPTETVVLYFITADNKLEAVARDLPVGVTTERVIAELQAGPTPSENAGLRNFLGDTMIVGFDLGAVPPIISLNPPFTNALTPEDRALLAGQLALTLSGRPGIGQVRFTLDGERWQPPVPGGVELTRDVTGKDFAPLVSP